ncbi:hypothetical protein Ocin01_17139 [Orchesella cincta]|uniref:Uncharacterized protein n=1 Tax=Orchesella cincta TaxID=48709 RepID=A0A1D2M985_ORCCI|nr:hypothetical protein Ocin01_17139 [Orchesella cincta]
MGPRSKIKKTRNTIMKSTKGKSSYYLYAVLGICIACLPFLVVSAQVDEEQVAEASDSMMESDLDVAESQHLGVAPQVVSVPTIPIPAVVPAPANVVPAASFAIPKTDLASAPSYAPRYSVPPVNPYRERLPYEVQNFRRRATEDEDAQPAEDDYQPSESKGKKSSPSVFKRVRNGIRNTGKAIVGAPSYIYKRYRGTWKKYFGGGGKKKKGGWKAWSPSEKTDGGWGGWEESEPSGGGWEGSSYPTEKGWKSSKGYGPPKGFDSNERRSDREPPRERDSDYYDRPARERTERPRDRQRWASNYKEETHYDDYDGRRTVATNGPSRKSPKRPSSGGSGNYRYDDDY